MSGMRFHLRSGFSLIELVLAAFIFAVGALALEATAASSLRRMRRSAALGLGASVARSRLETLAGSRCIDLRSGTDTVRGVVSSWIVDAPQASFARPVTQVVAYDLDGARREDAYRAMIPCPE